MNFGKYFRNFLFFPAQESQGNFKKGTNLKIKYEIIEFLNKLKVKVKPKGFIFKIKNNYMNSRIVHRDFERSPNTKRFLSLDIDDIPGLLS